MANPSEQSRARTKRSIFRFGLGIVAVLTVLLTGISSYRIISTVFFPGQIPTDYDCAGGTTALLAAVERARRTAAYQSAGERAALRDFRQALEPEWSLAPTIRKKCKQSGEPDAYRAYRTVEVLRYAEERAVRYEAIDLSKLRNDAPQLVGGLTQTPSKKTTQ